MGPNNCCISIFIKWSQLRLLGLKLVPPYRRWHPNHGNDPNRPTNVKNSPKNLSFCMLWCLRYGHDYFAMLISQLQAPILLSLLLVWPRSDPVFPYICGKELGIRRSLPPYTSRQSWAMPAKQLYLENLVLGSPFLLDMCRWLPPHMRSARDPFAFAPGC